MESSDDFLSAEGVLRTAFALGGSGVLQPKPRQLGFQLLQLGFQLWQLDLRAATITANSGSASHAPNFGLAHDSLFSLAQDALASPEVLPPNRGAALKKAVNGFPRLLAELVLSKDPSSLSQSELKRPQHPGKDSVKEEKDVSWDDRDHENEEIDQVSSSFLPNNDGSIRTALINNDSLLGLSHPYPRAKSSTRISNQFWTGCSWNAGQKLHGYVS